MPYIFSDDFRAVPRMRQEGATDMSPELEIHTTKVIKFRENGIDVRVSFSNEVLIGYSLYTWGNDSKIRAIGDTVQDIRNTIEILQHILLLT